MNLQIRNAEDFLRFSKALKDAGQKDLRNKLHRAMRDAAKPLIPKARAAARERLPHRGGLNEQIARSPIRVQVRTGRNAYGVRIVVPRGPGVGGSNRGVIRHPVFGDRERWVSQEVPPGWFDEVMEAGRPEIRDAVYAAAQRVLDDIVREAKH